jgi:hypothetical protein
MLAGKEVVFTKQMPKGELLKVRLLKFDQIDQF